MTAPHWDDRCPPITRKNFQCKDVPTRPILEYLAERQGRWTMAWDLENAFPESTPLKVFRAKMTNLHRRGLVGGCPCGCRGDFEITDKGLAYIGAKRVKPYTGY